jgi:ParB-like chromosome segregation protein Spo0J
LEVHPISKIKQIPLLKILPNPDQPRKVMDETTLNGLGESIKEVGQKTTAKVRPLTTEESARYPVYEYLMLGSHGA